MVGNWVVHRGRVGAGIVLGCLALLGFGSLRPAHGQGTARTGAAPIAPGGVRFKVSSVYLETRGRYDRERTVRIGQRAADLDQTLTFRNTAVEERFGLGFAGDVYHSSLFAYRADFVFGGRQEWFFRDFIVDRNHDSEAGPIVEYDVRTDILQSKPVAATLYARQIERFIPREFRQSYRETISDIGADFRYQSRVLPMRLGIHRFTSDIDGVDEEVVGRERDETALNYELDWRPSREHRLSLDYEYMDRITDQPSGGNRTTENVERWHDLDILHDLRWGPQDKYELQTNFEFRDESGDFPQDRVRFNPHLRTRHTPQLQTFAQYTLDEQQLTGARNLLQRVDLGFTRQIYESLTIDGSIFGEANDTTPSTRGWFTGGNLSMGYHKRTPFGQLQGSLSTDYSTRQITGVETTAPVVREPAAFRGSIPTYLDRDDVVLSSIQVENLDGSVRYRRNRDYRILAYGRKTALVRMVGSDIANGEVTHVSYAYVVPASTRFDNTNLNFELAHLFDNGIRPYYRLGVRDEEVTVRNLTPPVEEDITDQTFGFQWDRPRFTLAAEYDIHNSSLFPNEGYRTWADLYLLRGQVQNLAWSIVYSNFEFRGPLPRSTWRFETGLTYDRQLTKTMYVSTAARYANEDDTLDKRAEGITLEGRFRWEVRDVTVELRAEHHDLRDRWEDEANTRIWIELRRTFIP